MIPIKIYEIGGIGGEFNLLLPEKGEMEFTELHQPLPVRYTMLTGKNVPEDLHEGTIVRLGNRFAEIQTDVQADRLSNLRIWLFDGKGTEITDDLYAKVTEILTGSPATFRVYFTSVPREAEAFFQPILTSTPS